jgi:glycosyltransferase involved in cell wall biosynthesis
MNPYTLVTVIIPCLNVEKYIAEAISSALNQTHTDIEIICVDNGSVDATINIIKNFPQVQLIFEPKPGAPAARNKGLFMARGEWIQFLDADDILCKDKVQSQVSIINESPDLAFICGAHEKLNIRGEGSTIYPSGNDFFSPFINQAGNTCANLWNKDWLLKVNGWNESLKSSQESDLMLRLMLAGGKFLIDHQPLTIIRERTEGQISQRNSVERLATYIEVRLSFLEKLKVGFPNSYLKSKNRIYDFLMVTILELGSFSSDEASRYYNKIKTVTWRPTGQFGYSNMKHILLRMMPIKFFLCLRQCVLRFR